MLPASLPPLQAPFRRLPPYRVTIIALALGVAALPASVCAQDQGQQPASQSPKAKPASSDEDSAPVAFEADEVSYNSDSDIVTASGKVILRREGQMLQADTVSWNRNSGQIVASGNLELTDPDGNKLYADSMELTDDLKAGAMENMLLAFEAGGRMAARKGVRGESGDVVLSDVAYTACAVETPEGCEKKPSWRVTADRVIFSPDEKKVRFRGARLELFGVPLVPLIGLTVRTDGKGSSGFLIPDIRISNNNGAEISGTYYARLSDNRDLSLTAYAYTKVAPMLRARYRALTDVGAYQLDGYITHSSRIPISENLPDEQRRDDWRGYFASNGRFQLDPHWSITYSGRIASDRTFLRRYDISRDDRLRSMFDVERTGTNSYLSISGWATQTLRINDEQGQVPIALPLIDYRRRIASPILGGRVELQANTLAITRTSGQDTQRAFASAKWEMRRLTAWGQELTLTGLVRGDVYHSSDNLLTETAIYRGDPGWQARGVAIGAVDVKWPFIGSAFGGTQVLTPRVQIVATPKIRNLAVPNEDARAIDLEDSNLFALNRFPGYDRIEDGVRFTYGFDWQLERPGLMIKTTVGQSYRLTREPTLLPEGTGLSNRWSDFVGRTEIRFRDFVSFTHRFRLDKDSLAVRRNEFDATVGSKKTYVEVSYLRLNRDIDALEDLQDREEVRVAGRLQIGNYWSLFGAAVVNLTNKEEDPSFTSDGFEPLRTRLGVAYQDDCLEFGVTWRRDYADSGDARLGNTFQLFFALRNLGFK